MKTKKTGIFLDEKTKKYFVCTSFTTQDNHTIKKCKRGFATIKEAEAWKINTRQEYLTKTYASINNSKNGIELAIENYIKFKSSNTKPSSLRTIKLKLNQVFKAMIDNKLELKDLNIKVLNSIYSSIATNDTKAQSKNKDISVTINFIEYLDLMELIDTSINRKAKLIFKKFEVTEVSQKDIFENDEYENFISTFNDDEFHKLLFELLFYTGARISEVLALTWNDINLDNNEITFNKHLIEYANDFKSKDIVSKKSTFIMSGTKTQNKVVSIFGNLIIELKSYKQNINALDEDYLFYGKICKNTASRVLSAHLKQAGINKHITLHSFRHTHTTMLYDLGLDSKYIAERLGHSNENTSKIVYEHITAERKKKNEELLKNNFII